MSEPRTGWSALRDVVGGVLGIVLLLWLIGAMISGPPLVAYVLIPLAMLVSALSSPGVLLLLLMVLLTALVTASVLTGLAAVAHVPLLLVDRLSRRRETASRLTEDHAPADVVLRRRFLAGELSRAAYLDGMLALLKDRYQRGDLSLFDYEAAVKRLVSTER